MDQKEIENGPKGDRNWTKRRQVEGQKDIGRRPKRHGSRIKKTQVAGQKDIGRRPEAQGVLSQGTKAASQTPKGFMLVRMGINRETPQSHCTVVPIAGPFLVPFRSTKEHENLKKESHTVNHILDIEKSKFGHRKIKVWRQKNQGLEIEKSRFGDRKSKFGIGKSKFGICKSKFGHR